MRGICGYVRFDGEPLPPAVAGRLASRLAPDARLAAPTQLREAPGASFACSHWGVAPAASGELLAWDPQSGCLAVVDARLDDPAQLAAQLGIGHRVMPGTAGLILAAWLRWGERCADRLRGDFALAIWVSRERRLFLARDILGVRPLSLHHQPGRGLVFASRAAALPGVLDVPTTLDRGRIADALVTELEGVDLISTPYAAVQHLPPAHWSDVERAGRRTARYWRPEPGRIALPTSADGWVAGFAQRLEQAVARQLRAPGTLGCMLSGGLDSSALAQLAAGQCMAAGRPRLATFSSVSDDPAEPETAAIGAMVRQGRFAAHLLTPARTAAVRVDLLRLVHQIDSPFDVGALLVSAQYHAARAAGISTLLDGIDADTLLSEGSGLIRQLRRGRWWHAWRNVRGLQRVYPGFSAARYMLALMRASFVPAGVRAHLRRRYRDTPVQAALKGSLIAPDLAARVDLAGRLAELDAHASAHAAQSVTAQAARALAHPYTTRGMERYHRVAAWHGVQPGHPFADRDLLDFCVNLPDALRMQQGWTKYVLRRAMQGRLPDSVCWRTGKQHLGWALGKRLLLADSQLWRGAVEAQRPRLAEWVDLPRLDALLARTAASPGDESALGQLVQPVSLALWLQAQAERDRQAAMAAPAPPVGRR